MTALEAFRASLRAPTPPDGASLVLQALWWDAAGDWARAHECAQAQNDRGGAAVHAYLHRKEPDLANARYWYSIAGREVPTVALESEWNALVREFITSR